MRFFVPLFFLIYIYFSLWRGAALPVVQGRVDGETSGEWGGNGGTFAGTRLVHARSTRYRQGGQTAPRNFKYLLLKIRFFYIKF